MALGASGITGFGLGKTATVFHTTYDLASFGSGSVLCREKFSVSKLAWNTSRFKSRNREVPYFIYGGTFLIRQNHNLGLTAFFWYNKNGGNAMGCFKIRGRLLSYLRRCSISYRLLKRVLLVKAKEGTGRAKF